MALVLPVLCLLVFGIIDFGRLIQQQILLTEAVREGARTGALNGTAAEAQARVGKILGTGLTPTYTSVSVCSASSGFSDDATIGAQITFVPITPVFSVMSLFNSSSIGTMKLTATGVMNCVG
jgi:Flp pilus assembly protein TadG